MQSNLDKIWNSVQGLLSKELKGPSYGTWIKPTKLILLEEDKVVVAVKNEFNKNFLKQCYFEKITSCIERIIKRKIVLEIVVKADLNINEFISSIANLEESKPPVLESKGYLDHTFKYRCNLNPSYTFESFVVGPSNQFCHAAALAIAEAHGEHYNPLFIYGGVGLGKTHIACAIANYTLDQNKIGRAHV